MAQRVMLTACLTMVGACCLMAGVVWSQSTRANAQAAEANRRLAELLTQTQATNREMVKQLQAMAPPAKDQQWIPARFQLTLEKADGPPAVGYEVWLGRGDDGSIKAGAIHRYSDGEGLVDFGVIQPGDWEYRFEAAVGATRKWKHFGYLNAIPGQSVSKQIICPRTALETASVAMSVEWPKELADKGLGAIALFEFYGPRYQPPRRWSLWNSKRNGWQRRQAFIGSSSNQREIESSVSWDANPCLYLWRLPTQSEKHGIYLPGVLSTASETTTDAEQLFANLPSNLISPAADRIELDVGEYSLERLLIIKPHGDPKTAPGWQSFRILSLIQREENSTFFQIVSRQAGGTFQAISTGNAASGVSVPEKYWSRAGDRLVVRPGQKNEWSLPLPDELIQAVRANLNGEPKSRPVQNLPLPVAPGSS